MDKERIVGSSSHWNDIKSLFRKMNLIVSKRVSPREFVSYGVLLVYKGEGLFLQMSLSYEYKHILLGNYTGAKLYHFLSLITVQERELLLTPPKTQWNTVFPSRKMPKHIYRKLKVLQEYLPLLYELIPSVHISSGTYNDPYPYLLVIPKGRAKHGESGPEAALRELEEEAGIKLQEKDLSFLYVDRCMGTDGNLYTTFVYSAFVEERPVIKLEGGFKGYLWLAPTHNGLFARQMKILSTFLFNRNVRWRDCEANRDKFSWKDHKRKCTESAQDLPKHTTITPSSIEGCDNERRNWAPSKWVNEYQSVQDSDTQ